MTTQKTPYTYPCGGWPRHTLGGGGGLPLGSRPVVLRGVLWPVVGGLSARRGAGHAVATLRRAAGGNW
jgi:hypothetical protein